MDAFDIAIVGGGPAGVSAALRAADQGGHVCIIEQNRIGGAIFAGIVVSFQLYPPAH